MIDNMMYSTLCVDNFFNDPDKIEKMALSMPFYKCGSKEVTGVWPGYRTQELHLVNPEYYDTFSQKILSVYFGYQNDFECKITTSFQKINSDFFNGIDSGWIHNDRSILAGVIYLNKNIDNNNGTSIYVPKIKSSIPINSDIKKEMYSDFKKEDTLLYDIKRKENNELFEKTITFNNVYNRLVMYDSKQYHMENAFKMPENEYRLTQVFFIYDIKNAISPLELSRTVDL